MTIRRMFARLIGIRYESWQKGHAVENMCCMNPRCASINGDLRALRAEGAKSHTMLKLPRTIHLRLVGPTLLLRFGEAAFAAVVEDCGRAVGQRDLV